MSVTMLNDNNFNDIIKNSEIPVLVDFYADWCKPCLKIAPILEDISAENEGRLMICKINIDESRELAAAYQVVSIPNLISFKNGEVYKRVVGLVSKPQLLELVE